MRQTKHLADQPRLGSGGDSVKKLSLLLLFVGLLTAPAAADAWQSTDAIRVAAQQFATTHTVAQDGRAVVEARQVDPRLRLAACDEPLQAFLPSGSRLRGNGVVGVRCVGTAQWKLFVPVKVKILAPIALAHGSHPAGHRLTQTDVRWEEHDVAGLRGAYQAGRRTPVGQVLRQPVNDGQILRPNMVRAARVVRRGQQVTLAVSNGAMTIRMTGTALADGALGDRIRAKNQSSGRIVEGIVRRGGLLEVNLL